MGGKGVGMMAPRVIPWMGRHLWILIILVIQIILRTWRLVAHADMLHEPQLASCA